MNIDSVLATHIHRIQIFFPGTPQDQSLQKKYTMLCLKTCNITYRVHPYQDITQWSHTHQVSHKILQSLK